mgnify:CR=1 FL=1
MAGRDTYKSGVKISQAIRGELKKEEADSVISKFKETEGEERFEQLKMFEALWQIKSRLSAKANSLCWSGPVEMDDLLQETFAVCTKRHESFEQGTNLFGWASTCMRNLHIDMIRKLNKKPGSHTSGKREELRKEALGEVEREGLKNRQEKEEFILRYIKQREKVFVEEEEVEVPEEKLTIRKAIEHCLGQIKSEEKREYLWMQLYEGRTTKEISEISGTKLNTLLTWLADGKKSLATCLEAQGVTA